MTRRPSSSGDPQRPAIRVALIEDDADLSFTIRLNLEREGYLVSSFANGQEGLLGVEQGGFDFLILDLNLPDLDGFTICRELRRRQTTASLPILILTARSAEHDRIMGLELGADDYLVKPFSVRELLARVAAILRRARGTEADAAVYDDGHLRIDGKTLRVFVEGDEVRLAKKELELLWMLVRNRPAVVSRDRILSEVWQVAEDVETRTVDAHIRNLRKKIGKDRIRTVIGYGYQFETGEAVEQ
ncbi:MAG TPA: response regulator transcription factor [Thermoanaerobaculia bacterium]|nr:response regulator transcription factor [Thermoanaerobaculia bacterium]